MCVSIRSWRRSESSCPSAHRMPGAGGMATRPMRSSRATGVPCIGPAPPNGTSVHRRGSCPRSTETTRMPRTMLAWATRRMPAAAATRSMPSGPATCILDRPARGVGVELQVAAEARLAAQPAEHEIGIRDRRPRAALAVAGGPRHGFGADRPDAQRPAVVDPGDRPAARADGVDVDDGKADGDLADPGVARRLRPAVADQADVGAGAADIHGDDGVGLDQPGEMRAGDDASGRPRQHGVHGPCQRRLRPSSARRRPPSP